MFLGRGSETQLQMGEHSNTIYYLHLGPDLVPTYLHKV